MYLQELREIGLRDEKVLLALGLLFRGYPRLFAIPLVSSRGGIRRNVDRESANDVDVP